MDLYGLNHIRPMPHSFLIASSLRNLPSIKHHEDFITHHSRGKCSWYSDKIQFSPPAAIHVRSGTCVVIIREGAEKGRTCRCISRGWEILTSAERHLETGVRGFRIGAAGMDTGDRSSMSLTTGVAGIWDSICSWSELQHRAFGRAAANSSTK